MKVFIDTGAFLAIADKSDMSHGAVTSIYQQIIEQRAVLYTSNYIIDETITLIRARVGHKAAALFINGFAASKIKVLWVTRSDKFHNGVSLMHAGRGPILSLINGEGVIFIKLFFSLKALNNKRCQALIVDIAGLLMIRFLSWEDLSG